MSGANKTTEHTTRFSVGKTEPEHFSLSPLPYGLFYYDYNDLFSQVKLSKIIVQASWVPRQKKSLD